MTSITRKQEILAGARGRIRHHMNELRWSPSILAKKARVSQKKLKCLLESPVREIEADKQVLHRLVQFSRTSTCPWEILAQRLLRWSRDFDDYYL